MGLVPSGEAVRAKPGIAEWLSPKTGQLRPHPVDLQSVCAGPAPEPLRECGISAGPWLWRSRKAGTRALEEP